VGQKAPSCGARTGRGRWRRLLQAQGENPPQMVNAEFLKRVPTLKGLPLPPAASTPIASGKSPKHSWRRSGDRRSEGGRDALKRHPGPADNYPKGGFQKPAGEVMRLTSPDEER
jgi:hypothetical protein